MKLADFQDLINDAGDSQDGGRRVVTKFIANNDQPNAELDDEGCERDPLGFYIARSFARAVSSESSRREVIQRVRTDLKYAIQQLQAAHDVIYDNANRSD